MPGAIVSPMPVCSPWSECKSGVSFEDWVVRIFKLRDESDRLVQDIKRFLAEPEKMKQADEVVVAFGVRKGGTSAASAITTAKPGSQLARLAMRRCWLSSWAPSPTEDLTFTKDSECHGDPAPFLPDSGGASDGALG